ncbi:MAG: YHS domain-containing (seleno)protein [Planctomycetota bacterium]
MIRRFFTTAAVFALALAVTPSLTTAGEADQASAPLHTTALGLSGYSPVSYFSEDGPHVGSPEFAAEHAGVTYFFADSAEKKEFLADPEKFTPAYGGWCAYGMAVDNYFPVNPTLYKIVDGRLMLFLHNDQANALELWNAADESELVAKADNFWAAENSE